MPVAGPMASPHTASTTWLMSMPFWIAWRTRRSARLGWVMLTPKNM